MIELLAPAGNFKCLSAAVNAGCDAVYFGLKEFNMRATAKNFNVSDLPKMRKMSKKLYLALNTIIYDEELKKVEVIIKKAKKYVDAIICSDLAVMMICKKHKVPFHVSTQCSVSNSETAKFYKKLGAKRIVLARELNLKQIKKISKIIPVEVFVHGAMCVSVSGRCFTSQFLFNKSANRGECLQPCRRSYFIKDEEGNQLRVKNNYIFSAKDLCALPFVKDLKKAGISAFKIEGRNREPEYVDKTVRAYRKAIDKDLSEKEIKKELKELKKVYNRKFSSGFFIKNPVNDFSDIEYSNATQTKRFVGKVKHYYDKIKVALVYMNAGEIKIGDEIIITGKTTPIIYHKIKSMEINNKKVKKVKKGQEIAIKVPLCRKGDEIYKVVKK